MIDWVTAILPCKHDRSRLIDGLIYSYDALGNQQWMVEKKLSIEGSFSSKVQIKSHDNFHIWISGNPTKFLQGHNIFGSNDLRHLMGLFFDALLKQDIGLCPDPFQYNKIKDGEYQLTRVDVNESWHLDNKKDVLAWIRAVGSTAYMKHRGAGQFSGDTAYFGKNSRRWSLKCYSKGHELSAKGHRLPKELMIPELLEYADKALRIEAVIRSMELKRLGLDYASNWDIDTATMLLRSYLDNLEMSDVYMLKDDVLDSLPMRLRMVYQSWLNGDDLKQIMTKPTFYRVRKQLEKYGVDIATATPKEKTNVVPLVRYLKAEPVGIPDWAYEKKLVA